jgi:hypothetical protein
MQIVLPAGTPFGRSKVNDSAYVEGSEFVFKILQGNREDYDGLQDCRLVQQFTVNQPKWENAKKRINLSIDFHVARDGALRVKIRPSNMERT